MNTRQLRYVIKVAEERSFSIAAKKLYIAQPSLSQFISKVEKEVGYELFDRMATPLKLTAAGEVYVKTAQEILNLKHAMENRLRDMGKAQYGKLAVGVSPYNGLMPSALKQFFDTFPNCKVTSRIQWARLSGLGCWRRGSSTCVCSLSPTPSAASLL